MKDKILIASLSSLQHCSLTKLSLKKKEVMEKLGSVINVGHQIFFKIHQLLIEREQTILGGERFYREWIGETVVKLGQIFYSR